MEPTIDKNIFRYLEIVDELRDLKKEYQENLYNFYDGGHSFFECNSYSINRINELSGELKQILKILINE